jgi:hypothetical protein
VLWVRRLSLALALAAVVGLGTVASASAFTGFTSPTGNIGCVMSKGGVRCDIRHHSWKAPPKPKWCDVDYGGGVAVDKKGKAGIVCAGDTTLNSGPVLPYGSSINRGRFNCESQEAGMRCVNKRNGHGFYLNKQHYELF